MADATDFMGNLHTNKDCRFKVTTANCVYSSAREEKGPGNSPCIVVVFYWQNYIEESLLKIAKGSSATDSGCCEKCTIF